MNPSPPKEGDLVRLKSGSPIMTVEQVWSEVQDPFARCTWFDDRKTPQHTSINLGALDVIDAQDIGSDRSPGLPS